MSHAATGTDARAAPAHWECDVVLSDGGALHVRPLAPDDAERLIAFGAGLSDETQFLPFLAPDSPPNTGVLAWLDGIDHHARVALVAELGDRLFLGLATYEREAGTDRAEAAFVVADEYQGRGIGTVLLEHLAAVARERGITRFVADTPADNGPMLGVFRAAGFAEQTHVVGSNVHVELLIEPTDRARAAVEAREHRAEAASIARVLTPRSVAVIGASRNPDTRVLADASSCPLTHVIRSS